MAEADWDHRDVETACPQCLSGAGPGLGHPACQWSPYMHCPKWAVTRGPYYDGAGWSATVARVGPAGHLLRVAEVVLGQRPRHPLGPPLCHQDNWWCGRCEHRRTFARKWHGEEAAVKRWVLGDLRLAGEEVAQGLDLTSAQCRQVLWDVLVVLEEKQEREWAAIHDAIVRAFQEPSRHKLRLTAEQEELMVREGYL